MREVSDPREMIPYPFKDFFPQISIETMCREAAGNLGNKECVNYSYPLLGAKIHVPDAREVGIYGGGNGIANDLIVIVSEEEHG